MSLLQNFPLLCTDALPCLTTSQNVTAPKRVSHEDGRRRRLTTSQNVTAPKQGKSKPVVPSCLTTSQNVTAPKLFCRDFREKRCLTTSQNVTAPKRRPVPSGAPCSLTTSQNVTAPKPLELRARRLVCLTTSQNVTAPKRRFDGVVELCGVCPELDVSFLLGHGRSPLNIRYTYAMIELLNGGGSRCFSGCS